MPTCWIIAGPNGAGKTTFALDFLPKIVACTDFINADLIAAGLSPLAPERELLTASRLFLQEINQRIAKKKDFAFETTLSGRSYLRLIKNLRQAGWTVEIIYLALPSATISALRVAERVAHGGHNIPVQDIKRRFPRSLNNLLTEYSYLANSCQCFMNTAETPMLIFEQQGDERNIADNELYQLIYKRAKL